MIRMLTVLLALTFSTSGATPTHHKHHRKRHHYYWHNGAIASWFYDSGSTACGTHYKYGFASLFLSCGQTITMVGPNGNSIRATMEDHGPYVGGRTFDLNPGLKQALGCSDICSLRWR